MEVLRKMLMQGDAHRHLRIPYACIYVFVSLVLVVAALSLRFQVTEWQLGRKSLDEAATTKTYMYIHRFQVTKWQIRRRFFWLNKHSARVSSLHGIKIVRGVSMVFVQHNAAFQLFLATDFLRFNKLSRT